MALKKSEEIKIGKHKISVSNPQKLIYPKPKITKSSVIDYYVKIAPYMLPYLKNRPLSMQRFPDGISDQGFYQKDVGSYFPKWIKRFSVKKEEGGTVHHVIINDAASLVYISSQLCLVFHIWLSKIKKINYPDRLIFDLDPSGKDFNQVQHAALKLKDLLENLGLTPFVMTTGSRGLHVVVPLKATENFEYVRDFARDVAQILRDQDPTHLTLELRKNKRDGKIFIDYLRNGFGATSVSPYSLRARPGAPVATPLEWREVELKSLKPDQWNIKNIFSRLKKGDPWKNINKYVTSLKKARKKLDRIMEKNI